VSDLLEFHAASIPGTEQALCDELRELAFASVRLNRGGIPFRGTREDGWRACLQSRIAQRIQLVLTRFPAPGETALYKGAQTVDWSRWITPRHTLSVSAVCVGSRITHSGFVALKVKDAIVDSLRDSDGKRPSVDKDDPDIHVFVYHANNKTTLYLDLCGTPLHKRGYRLKAGEAPLRETLASALLRMSGWDRRMPLIDPMCGSGTIAIEAAQWAVNKAPGLDRGRFGFERWVDFTDRDEAQLKALCGEMRGAITDSPPKIQAADVDQAMMDAAKTNARAAGVSLAFRCRSVLDLQAGDTPAVVVTNPPYGVRIQNDMATVQRIAAKFEQFRGWRVCILDEGKTYERLIRVPPTEVHPIKNGDLDCRFLVYDM